MEIYVGPSEEAPHAALTREQVLTAFRANGILVASAEVTPSGERARWILSFEQTNARLEFQETDQGLVFATLDQSMFADTNAPDLICAALEGLGWRVDQENVG